jgi:hypothetical protein
VQRTLGWRAFAVLWWLVLGAQAAGAQALFANGFETPLLVVNEIDSNPSPDWIEFYNPNTTPSDVSGWFFTDSAIGDPTHVYTFAPGSVVPAGGFVFFFETTDFNFGLGAVDEVHLYDASGTPVDAFGWAVHAAGTLARCPDGSGAFVDVATPTRGAANAPACP